MSIDIEKVANLARLNLTAEDKANYPTQLNTILNLAEQMQAVNTTGILPLAHPFDASQPLRDDVVTEVNERDLFQAIAPATESGLYLVPQVINRAKAKETEKE